MLSQAVNFTGYLLKRRTLAVNLSLIDVCTVAKLRLHGYKMASVQHCQSQPHSLVSGDHTTTCFLY